MTLIETLGSHRLQVSLASIGVGAENIVRKRKDHIEVSVRVFMVQIVIPGQKLINWPVTEWFVLRFVHLQMDFVPDPVMGCNSAD